MPTMAKLVSAILFAALGWFTADTIVREVLPEGTRVGSFREMLGAMGLLLGWRTLGRIVTGVPGKGTTLPHAAAAGFAAALLMAAAALLLWGFYRMILESQDLAYASPGEAVSDMASMIWGAVQTNAHPDVLAVLLGGGAAAGLVGGLVGRRAT